MHDAATDDVQAVAAPDPRERDRVLALTAYGVPENAIARLLEIDLPDLRRRFADELARGAAEANLKVAQSLFRKATGDGPQAVVAGIFWLKCRAGWRDRPAPDPDPLGKKALRRLAAETAGLGSEWGDDLAWRPAEPVD